MGVFDAAKKLNKKYNNDGMSVRADVLPKYKRLACNDLGMDYPLFGGLPYGRICVYSGREGSGKTTAACVEMAAYQRANPDKVCVFVDVECALDTEFICAMTGLDPTKMLHVTPAGLSAEEIFEMIAMYQAEDDIGMIILDSIPALRSGLEIESGVAEDKGMAANTAKSLGRFLKDMVSGLYLKQNILILINQTRISGKTFTGANIYSEPGGDAPKYYSSVSVRFGTRTYTNGDKVDVREGDAADGFRLKFAITKNKTANTSRGGGFLTFRYDTGLDWLHDMIEVAKTYELIERPNNLTYIPVNLVTGEYYVDEDGKQLKWAGQAKMFDYFRTHLDFQNDFIKMMNEYISAPSNVYKSLLDARELAEIKEEETSVTGGLKPKKETLVEAAE